MKHRFLTTLILAVLTLTTNNIFAQYTTAGDGSNYTLEDLVTVSSGAVTGESGNYIINQAITIAETDTFSITEDAFIFIDSAVTIDILGVFYCNAPEEVLFSASYPTKRYGTIRLDDADGSFINNAVFAWGGGLRISNSDDVVISNSYFQYNQVEGNGGIVAIFQCSPVITHCNFSSNVNAAISTSLNAMASPEITYCEFRGNNTGNSNVPQINLGQSAETPIIIRNNYLIGGEELNMVGGISIFHLYNSEIHAIIDSNTIIQHRYGINIQGSQITYQISNNTLLNNNLETNPNNGGSGITFYGNSTGTVSNNVISGNLWGITILGEATPNLGDMSDENSIGGQNEIYENGNGGQTFNLYNNTPNNIMAQGNYWGTTDLDSVEMGIFHQTDDESLGFVNYLPVYNPEGETSVEEHRFEFTVAPNPATDYIKIESTQVIASALLLSINGEIVGQIAPNSSSQIINTSILKSGIYILLVKDLEGNQTSRKIVIQ